ncbi:beta-glucosidase [Psychroflexus sp. CAK57W]|uniref:glucoamylase family protein n=1 Tax=Psychroflexus curvus TaxID=2873595 RepID=UPI001CCA20AE|nr:glucoamylase family protein [Psychroflexus curvus]MBZ9626511.1 beta-glucosidase [Psychroflexus curvus]MBZ9786277.1 beta-glucosidase [Psychroflexus curvus]
MTRYLYFIGLLLILSSCSSDEGPGYQEPYDPNSEIDEEEQLTDEELLEKVQKQTFKYFWEFAGTNSGLARERSQADAYGGQGRNIVTIGGSGFGIAAFPVAVERGWISRAEAIGRLDKILDFLEEVPTYHGAFSHWYLDDSAQTRPFSERDNGGDLVETAFLIQGLLIARQYFSGETEITNRITALWEAVEWDWYTQGENVLYWHWSPNYAFDINLRIQGWNESLMVYVLASASPTYTVDPKVYHQGWASNGNMVNNRQYYGIDLPLGPAYGGPLFFAHYSFIGLDPRNLSDQYTNYWEQNVAHSLIHYNYAIDNPKNFEGYGENSWGFTASDSYEGYSAHSPANDLGVITPTAALSSFPYTPEESMKALRYFYEEKGNELWGSYGFYDAFSEEENWVADGYLAIDQGPIISMIENHRTGLIWDLFMQDEEIQAGLNKLGFNY